MFESLQSMLEKYQPYDDSEASSIKSLEQFLADSKNPYDRSNLFAHIVCDAWVVSPEQSKVLLLLHKEIHEYLAPGGHADGSPDLLFEARRELHEETGISPENSRVLLNGGLFDVNIGNVPERLKPHGIEPAHLHFDICFAFEVEPKDIKLKISDESLELGWHPIEKALEIIMPCHKRRVLKTINGYLK